MIEWETKNNILNKDKRMSIKKKKEIRIEQMIKVKEKRDRNIVDTYHEVKLLVFFSKNLNKGHSYYVLLGGFGFILYNTLTNYINYLVIYIKGSN